MLALTSEPPTLCSRSLLKVPRTVVDIDFLTPSGPRWVSLDCFHPFLPAATSESRSSVAAKKRPSRKLEAVKRLLAADDSVTLDGEDYLVEEIASLLFGAIKAGAATSGVDVRKAVVTIPANSKGLARLRTKICAGMVGIEVPVLINEPTAAAMAYGIRATADQNVLVVDWGGGALM